MAEGHAEIYKVSAVARATMPSAVDTSDCALSLTMGAPQPNLPAGQKPSVHNPEHMIACGFASCLAQTLFAEGRDQGLDVSSAEVRVEVFLSRDESGLYHFGAVPSITLSEAACKNPQALVRAALKRCPYARFVRSDKLAFAVVNGRETPL